MVCVALVLMLGVRKPDEAPARAALAPQFA
jgi:hypothetical protein